jgi:hypothetical protein
MHLSQDFQDFVNHSNHVGAIRHRTGSLLLSYLATSKQIKEMEKSGDWYDSDDSRRNNKDKMKEFGGAVMGYRKYHRELTIIGISKTVEDLIVDLKDYSGNEFKFWKSNLELNHFKAMKYIRQLNNTIKHSRGLILDDGSISNTYLLKECKVRVNTDIGQSLDIDIEDYIIKAFIFQMDLCKKTLNISNMFEIPDPDAIRSYLIPPQLFFKQNF